MKTPPRPKAYQTYIRELKDKCQTYAAKQPPKAMIGYHMNLHQLDFVEDVTKALRDVRLINNVGDPYSPEGHFQQHTLQQEKKLVSQLVSNWGGTDENCWGYITTGGTEGNEAGIFAGIEKRFAERPVILFSDQAHYSVEKICKNSHHPYLVVPSQPSGEMDYQHLECVLETLRGSVVIVATLGTTMKGASDDLYEIHRRMNKVGYSKKNGYIHVDAALAGGHWHLDAKAPRYKIGEDFDSLSISGHKWYGGFIAGLFAISRDSMGQGKPVQYIKTIDQSISGSRNGMIPPLWTARLCQFDWEKEYQRCQDLVNYALERFKKIGVSATNNPFSTMVYFKKPTEETLMKYQLPVDTDTHTGEVYSHIIVLPHVTQEILDEMITPQNFL